MLSRTLKAKSLLNKLTAARSVYTVPGTNCVVPTSGKDCIEFLDKKRPEFTCVYFHASWNPMCEEIEKDYHNFAGKNAGWTHLKVDCDATPQVKFYFDARVEPQFLLLLNGTEVKRQVGYNFNLVETLMEDVV